MQSSGHGRDPLEGCPERDGRERQHDRGVGIDAPDQLDDPREVGRVILDACSGEDMPAPLEHALGHAAPEHEAGLDVAPDLGEPEGEHETPASSIWPW
jgi:hypothetical protein